jgi:hypothetical protein
MRAAWVGGMKKAMDSGAIDGFFIDITPQAMANFSGSADGADPVDP